MSSFPYRVELCRWHDARDALAAVRRDVFIVEQAIPEDLEWDDADAVSLHALARGDGDAPVGTARLLPDGHIGRMAVLARHRGRGVGRALLEALIAASRARGDALSRLNAQVHALGFYERLGYRAHGPVFDDAGIPHRAMSLPLMPPAPPPGE